MKHLSLIILLLWSVKSYSYIENTVKGYANCLSCHYSPTGGNLLNDYGRSLSKEHMSTWAVGGKSEQAFFGAVKESKWARIGGDVRSVQTYIDNPFVESGQLFLMQSNVELGLKLKNFLFVGALGFRGGPSESPSNGEILSERHYVMMDVNSQTKLRAGKFKAVFGINDPNHTRKTKSLLGFGTYSETYNVEFFRFTENYEFLVNASFGAFDGRREETYVSTSFTHYLDGSSRIGGAVLFAENDSETRQAFSGYGVFSVSKKLYGMYELDYQKGDETGTRYKDLFVGYTRLGYLAFKGFQAYLSYEHAETDLNVSGSRNSAPGFGMQWLPIPHTELQFEVQRVKDNLSGIYTTAGFLQAHYYF